MSRPARSEEARENQLISLAYDLAEKRLREGTATSAEIVQLMKMGSRSDRLDRELAETRIELMKAKKESLESAAVIKELYTEAIAAFRRYNGAAEEGEVDEDIY